MSDFDLFEDETIVKEFIAESSEMIEDVELKLIDLDSNLGDEIEYDIETINSIFRLFHTIKGTSGFLSLSNLEYVTHHAETLLDQVRKGDIVLNKDHTKILLEAIDFLKKLLKNIDETGSDDVFAEEREDLKGRLEIFASGKSPDTEEKEEESDDENQLYTDFISDSINELLVFKENIVAIQNQLDDMEKIKNVYDIVTKFNFNCKENNYKDLTNLSGKVSEYLLHLLDGDFKAYKEDIDTIYKIVEVFMEAINDLLMGEDEVTITGCYGMIDLLSDIISQGLKNFNIEKKPSEKVEVQENEEPKEEVKESSETVLKENPAPKVEKKSEVKKQKAKKSPAVHSKSSKDQFIRVDVDKVDKLISWIGELSIAEMMLIGSEDLKIEGLNLSNFENTAHDVNRLLADIQKASMSLRMVPIKASFNKMTRLVHDLSSKMEDKDVRLVMIGEDTEIDKSVSELIVDPLMHMVRNSCDHGLESREEREKVGKKPLGTVKLEAKHVGGEVWIIIEDDGRGLNRDAILEKAITNGLIDIEKADQLKDQDIYRFIFAPGFSTAEQVTELSGRGVGMDVVSKNIEKIKGKIDLFSTPGKGTKTILKIPLTMSIIEGLLVRIGKAKYTIPLLSIIEGFQPQSESITVTMDGQEVVKVRDDLIPIVRLHDLYNIKSEYKNLEDGILVTVKDNEELYSLFVDEILEQQQAIVKPLPAHMGKVRGVSGCTILGDGNISPIIDIGNIVELAKENDMDLTFS